MNTTKYNVMSLLEDLPFDKLEQLAKETHVDYKAKKLQGTFLLVLLLTGFLRTSRLSQRYLGEDSSIVELQHLFGVRTSKGAISHSSISERLQNVNADFFMESYNLLVDRYAPIFENEQPFEVRKVDSTLVAETANKLKEGFSTGNTNLSGKDRRQIKYTMVQNDFAVTLARILTDQRDSGENGPLSSAVLNDIAQSDGKPCCYLIDRGLSSADSMREIHREADKTDCFFIARLKANRKYSVVEDALDNDASLQDDKVAVLSDQIATLDSDKSETKTKYRIIHYKFKTPRPKNPSPKSHGRRYDETMLLLTDNLELSALEIAELYRKRWEIEVFYKFLKQNLSFAHFLSTSKNGIEVVLYLTLITALLIKVFMHFTNLGPKIAIVRMENQIIIWMRENYSKLEDGPKPQNNRKNKDHRSSDH